MDGLIGLLVVIAIAAAASSGKKKKADRARSASRRAFDQAHAAGETPPVRKPDAPEPQRAKAPKPVAARPAQRDQQPEPAQPRAHSQLEACAMESGSLTSVRTEGTASVQGTSFSQGSLSTQGETAAEHAEHRRRIAAEEERLRLETQRLEDVRRVNLDQLRAAVVMSEVLGKPLSLRPRGRR